MSEYSECVSVLFVRRDSNYKQLGVDAWDSERDAMRYDRKNSVIAHPPCRLFGRMRQFSKADKSEKIKAYMSVELVRKFGGVLEHPASSTLWKDKGLPSPGAGFDQYGGWTMPINQHCFGHKAQKSTWLYIVGCSPKDLPDFPIDLSEPTHCIRPSKKSKSLAIVTKSEREHTPLALATWLIQLATICHANKAI